MYAIAKILTSMWSMWLPEGTSRHLLIACRAFAVPAVALAGLCVANIWVSWRPAAMSDARAGAAVTIVIAVMCWLVAIRDDAERRSVTLALADAVRRLPEDQRRELLVRAVSGR